MINLEEQVLVSYTDKDNQFKQETVHRSLAAELVDQLEYQGCNILNVE